MGTFLKKTKVALVILCVIELCIVVLGLCVLNSKQIITGDNSRLFTGNICDVNYYYAPRRGYAITFSMDDSNFKLYLRQGADASKMFAEQLSNETQLVEVRVSSDKMLQMSGQYLEVVDLRTASQVYYDLSEFNVQQKVERISVIILSIILFLVDAACILICIYIVNRSAFRGRSRKKL